MFHGDNPPSGDYSRTFHFPSPFLTKKIRLDWIKTAKIGIISVEFLGLSASTRLLLRRDPISDWTWSRRRVDNIIDEHKTSFLPMDIPCTVEGHMCGDMAGHTHFGHECCYLTGGQCTGATDPKLLDDCFTPGVCMNYNQWNGVIESDAAAAANGPITKIVHVGNSVDFCIGSIQVYYGGVPGPVHGVGGAGSKSQFDIQM